MLKDVYLVYFGALLGVSKEFDAMLCSISPNIQGVKSKGVLKFTRDDYGDFACSVIPIARNERGLIGDRYFVD